MTTPRSAFTPGTNSICFPLRSNANWFLSRDALAELDRRLKVYSVLYEQLSFENGRIITAGGANGVFELRPPVEAIDRSEINFFRPGSHYGLAAGPSGGSVKEVLGGEALFSFEIDFFPVWQRTGLGAADWTGWFTIGEVPPEARVWIRKQVESDRMDEGLKPWLPENLFLKEKLLEAFHGDSLALVGTTVSVGEPLGRIAQCKMKKTPELSFDLRPEILNAATVEVRMADFSGMEWDEIAELRSSAAAQDLREMIARVSAEVRNALPDAASGAEIEALIARSLLREVAGELRSRKKGVAQSIFDLCLNPIPWSWILSLGQSWRDVIEDRSSWISFLH